MDYSIRDGIDFGRIHKPAEDNVLDVTRNCIFFLHKRVLNESVKVVKKRKERKNERY